MDSNAEKLQGRRNVLGATRSAPIRLSQPALFAALPQRSKVLADERRRLGVSLLDEVHHALLHLGAAALAIADGSRPPARARGSLATRPLTPATLASGETSVI